MNFCQHGLKSAFVYFAKFWSLVQITGTEVTAKGCALPAPQLPVVTCTLSLNDFSPLCFSLGRCCLPFRLSQIPHSLSSSIRALACPHGPGKLPHHNRPFLELHVITLINFAYGGEGVSVEVGIQLIGVGSRLSCGSQGSNSSIQKCALT